MPVMDVQVRTMTCDRDGCDKTITFNISDGQKVVEENPWVNAGRFVQTGDRRAFFYCSDECEVIGVGTGKHNIPDAKKIVETPSVGAAQAIKIAAQAAADAAEATKAIKSGKPAKLQVVKR